jgi:hypothetical protein
VAGDHAAGRHGAAEVGVAAGDHDALGAESAGLEHGLPLPGGLDFAPGHALLLTSARAMRQASGAEMVTKGYNRMLAEANAEIGTI